jgi:hypothetical protein
MADYSRYIHRISVPDPHPSASTGSREIHDFDLYDEDDEDDEDDDADSAATTLGKVVRQVAAAQRDALDFYVKLHNQSNGERDHGWLRDFGPNILDAMKKGQKKLRKSVRIKDEDDTDYDGD